jgi:hypothetical protein
VAAVYGAHSRLAVALYLGTVALSSLCLAVAHRRLSPPKRQPARTGQTGKGR